MSAPDDDVELKPDPQHEEAAQEATIGDQKAYLTELATGDIQANESNPRLDFPQAELDRLAESIELEGILVPVVVYPSDDKFVLVDGERRFRCARDLGLEKVPALVTTERSEHDVLLQMFNIHLIREPWRDVPTALALGKLADKLEEQEGEEPTDPRLAELTGLSVERVRQLRYVITLPEEWQGYIRTGKVPMNFFWELKRNIVDQLSSRRPALLAELGEDNVRSAFVQKRLDGVITDTVSLRKVAPIIRFAQQEADTATESPIDIDQTIRDLVTKPEAGIDDAYEDTVQMLVEVDKLGRRTASMISAFKRLLSQAAPGDDRDAIVELGQDLITSLKLVLGESTGGGE